MPYSPFQITIQTWTPHILLCQGLHFAMPGWLLCSRSRTFPQRVGGTITLFPHKMHLSSTLTVAPVNIGSTVDIPWNHLCGPTITTVLRYRRCCKVVHQDNYLHRLWCFCWCFCQWQLAQGISIGMLLPCLVPECGRCVCNNPSLDPT